jgi:hypothetical protein
MNHEVNGALEFQTLKQFRVHEKYGKLGKKKLSKVTRT